MCMNISVISCVPKFETEYLRQRPKLFTTFSGASPLDLRAGVGIVYRIQTFNDTQWTELAIDTPPNSLTAQARPSAALFPSLACLD